MKSPKREYIWIIKRGGELKYKEMLDQEYIKQNYLLKLVLHYKFRFETMCYEWKDLSRPVIGLQHEEQAWQILPSQIRPCPSFVEKGNFI